MARFRSVPVSEILAHPSQSLRAKDYLPDDVPVLIHRIETGYVVLSQDPNTGKHVNIPRSLLKRYKKYAKERESLMRALEPYYHKQEGG